MDSQNKEIVSQKFNISSQKENITIDLQDESYIPSVMEKETSKTTEYSLYVKDGEGNIATETCQAWLYHHDDSLFLATAYPNWVEIKPLLENDLSVSATVNFQEYLGKADENGTIIIEYPRQEDGSYVQLKWWDDYGCLGTRDMTVKSEGYVGSPSITVWRDRTTFIYDELSADQRLAVRIGNEVYYSSYGAGSSGAAVVYPLIPENISSVTVWVESKNGSKSQEKTYDVKVCDLEYCNYNYRIYPSQATGTIQDSRYGDSVTTVSTTINGHKYQTNVINGAFTLEYPRKQENGKLEIVFSDEHGCTYSVLGNIYNYIWDVITEKVVNEWDILKKSASAEVEYKDIRMCARVGGKTYYSGYSTKGHQVVRVNYPQQKIGTPVVVWFEHTTGSYTSEETYSVYNRPMGYSVNASTTKLTGKYYGEKKAKIVIVASGKQYNCKLVKKRDSFGDVYFTFSVSYPKQKVNSYLKIKISDEDGYSRTGKIKLKNIAQKLSVASVSSGSVKVTGKTVAKSKVTVKIKNKKYKGKANKSGKFAIKIKQVRAGTKVKVSVVTPEGYTVSKAIRVKLAAGSVRLPSYIYRNNNSVSVNVENGQKGDKLKVNVGGTIYTQTIKQTKKRQNVTVNINPAAAGTGVVLTLCDKFGQEKCMYRTMVYFGDTIYVGMSAEEACLTTWGTPRKNNWGGIIQWVFRKGSTTLYVYIRNGRVYSMQQLNY